MPEARNRERSALAAFAPLAKHVLGSKALGCKRRINLAFSFVMSRLAFGVHIWSCFGGKARAILYSVYMRVWRRVAGDPRYQRTRWTDHEIRQQLEVPSFDCFVRRRRLAYLSRLARAQFDALHASLQARTKHGTRLPWVELVVRDLQVLKYVLPDKFGTMPDPSDNLQQW